MLHRNMLKQLYRWYTRLSEASCGYNEIDGVAVTYGPGLVGALLVGLSLESAYALGFSNRINHLVGHLYADFWKI